MGIYDDTNAEGGEVAAAKPKEEGIVEEEKTDKPKDKRGRKKKKVEL